MRDESKKLYKGAYDPGDGAFDNLQMEIRAYNEYNGWRILDGPGLIVPGEGPRRGPWFGAYVGLAHSEVSEALDAYRDKQWAETREDGKPLGVRAELADAIIRVIDMADIWGVDLWRAIEEVMAFNWTRPYQHGGRIL